jgi:hypothetical protein
MILGTRVKFIFSIEPIRQIQTQEKICSVTCVKPCSDLCCRIYEKPKETSPDFGDKNMKRSVLFMTVLGLLAIGLTSVAWAYRGYGYGHRNCRPRSCVYRSCTMQPARWAQHHNYNPNIVETLTGEVVKVETITGRGRSGGTHLILKTDKETLAVHVGPQWYLRDQDVTFKSGDKIEVKGSRITYDHEPVLIAGQLSQDGHVLKLRDSRGIPLWAGRGRSQ